jgi:UrcA family protein
MNRFTTSLILAAACLSAPAFAGTASVAWKDLDLSSDAGKTELNRRIDAAAQAVCTHDPKTGTMISRKGSSSCLNEARGIITAQIEAKRDASSLAAGRGRTASADARR